MRCAYILGKTFTVLLKTMKTMKVQPSEFFHAFSISMNNWTQIYMLPLMSIIKAFNMLGDYWWLLVITGYYLNVLGVIPLQLDTPSLS